MSRKIPITESLRDYVERLHYEAVRYKDLLATVGRDCCPMTDEEWDSSRSYFQDLCREAQESLRCAMDTLYELYGDQIGRGCWRVDFKECAIVLGDDPGPSGPAVRDGNAFPESYADQLYRLFPPEKITPMVINGERAKNITIKDIQKVVREFLKVSQEDLISDKRSRHIVYARDIAIYLCRQLLDVPYATIGEQFDRNHSTILYSFEKIEKKMQSDRGMQEELEELKHLIRES